jgi:hypothetical protein
LFATPRRCDVGDRFIAPPQSLAQYAGDHREWNQQYKDEGAYPEQFDYRAVAFSE